MEQPNKNYGVRVTAAAVGINLALGILYTWSVISKDIPKDWNWQDTEKSWPYAVACLMFSLMMVPAGRLQDRIGPRIVATIGGLLVGAGMILVSFTTSFYGYILGFGILAGAGIGFGYASATPPAVKWFSAKRTGLIAGIVVSGFGLSPVYASHLSKWLISEYGLPHTMLTLGIAFAVVVVGLSQLLVAPPAGYVPAGAVPRSAAGPSAKKEDFTPWEMLRTRQFYLLWFMYVCGAGAGLMIISKLSPIAEGQAGLLKMGSMMVAAMAVGNGAGRILAGVASDRLGRKPTLAGCFVVQSLLMLILSRAQADTFMANVYLMGLLSALLGANYGANLSLFPSITKDYYGLKNFGINYGLVFTAWGIGGFVLPLTAGKLHDKYLTYEYAYYIASGLLVLAAVVTFFVKPPKIAHHDHPS
jgi:MFS transporter, OFA family, oxalate/formate antiporter